MADDVSLARKAITRNRSWPVKRLDDLRQDVRFGLRHFRRSPGLAATVVLTLMVAVSATLAVASLVEGVLLRSLPVRDQDRLLFVQKELSNDASVVGFPYADVVAIRDSLGVFADASGVQYDGAFPHRRPLTPANSSVATASRCWYASGSSGSCGARGAGCSRVSREVETSSRPRSLAGLIGDFRMPMAYSLRFARNAKHVAARHHELAGPFANGPEGS